MEGINRLKSVFGRYTLMIWLAGMLLGAAPLLRDISATKGIHIGTAELIGRDFVNIWHGGEMANAGQANDVYDREKYREKLAEKVGIRGIFAYSYPPHMLVASMPFGVLSYPLALALWSLATLGLFWYAAKPWLSQANLPSWIVLLFPATFINLGAGHFGFLIGALVLMGWWHARDRPLVSGAAFAMMTVKPHLGILVPIILAGYRCWRTILWAGMGTMLLVVASAFLFGWDLWAIWIKSTLPFQASLVGVDNPNLAYPYMMPTVERMAWQYGLGPMATLCMQIGLSMAALGLLLQGWRRGIGVGDLGLLSIPVTYILLPYVFTYDMVAFNLAILVLAARAGNMLSGFEKTLLGVAFLLPAIHVPMALWGVAVTPLVIIAALWILVRALGRETAPTQ